MRALTKTLIAVVFSLASLNCSNSKSFNFSESYLWSVRSWVEVKGDSCGRYVLFTKPNNRDQITLYDSAYVDSSDFLRKTDGKVDKIIYSIKENSTIKVLEEDSRDELEDWAIDFVDYLMKKFGAIDRERHFRPSFRLKPRTNNLYIRK